MCWKRKCRSYDVKVFEKYIDGLSNCPDLVLVIICQKCGEQYEFGTC